MSTTQAQQGFCYVCETAVEDLGDHLAEEHPWTFQKPRTPIMSWQDRLDRVVEAITEIRQETDIASQIRRMDVDVIQQLYLVRARLTQMKRISAQAKEG